MKHGPRGGETVGEAKTRLRLLMEDVSDELDADACRAAIRAGKASWEYMPTCKAIVDAAQPFLAERRTRNREQREAHEAATRKALPPPIYVDLTSDENKRVLDEMYAAMDRAQMKETGITATPHKLVDALAPLRTPTADELAKLATEFAVRPRAERMTMAAADYSALGMATSHAR